MLGRRGHHERQRGGEQRFDVGIVHDRQRVAAAQRVEDQLVHEPHDALVLGDERPRLAERPRRLSAARDQVRRVELRDGLGFGFGSGPRDGFTCPCVHLTRHFLGRGGFRPGGGRVRVRLPCLLLLVRHRESVDRLLVDRADRRREVVARRPGDEFLARRVELRHAAASCERLGSVEGLEDRARPGGPVGLGGGSGSGFRGFRRRRSRSRLPAPFHHFRSARLLGRRATEGAVDRRLRRRRIDRSGRGRVLDLVDRVDAHECVRAVEPKPLRRAARRQHRLRVRLPVRLDLQPGAHRVLHRVLVHERIVAFAVELHAADLGRVLEHLHREALDPLRAQGAHQFGRHAGLALDDVDAAHRLHERQAEFAALKVDRDRLCGRVDAARQEAGLDERIGELPRLAQFVGIRDRRQPDRGDVVRQRVAHGHPPKSGSPDASFSGWLSFWSGSSGSNASLGPTHVVPSPAPSASA